MADKSTAAKVKSCLGLYNQAIQLLDNATDELPEGLSLELKDQRSRFKIWSANVGAHRTGTSCLEYRLRDASHIKERVLSLLDELQQLIGDASAIVSGEVVPWNKLPRDEVEEDDSDGPDMPSTELEQIAMDVKEVVDGLLRLNMTIRNPAPHDRFIASLNTETTYYEVFDIDHVKAKFSEMEPWLADRLGKAISRRRQYFKYRRSHHDKLAYGIDEETEKAAPSTLASSILKKLKESAEFSNGDDESDSGWLSQTSFATSVQQAERLRVPPLPSEAQHGPFECPFCYMIVSAMDRKSWKKHVFGDLRPYVCLERVCLNPEQELARRHDWIDHTSRNHWTTYHCPAPGCVKTFESAAACKNHVERSHSGQIQQHQLQALITLHAEKQRKTGFQCPFCNESQSSLAVFRRHVGRHQEHVSLFALPRTGADENDGDMAEGAHSDALDGEKGSNAGNLEDDYSSWDSVRLDDVELLLRENERRVHWKKMSIARLRLAPFVVTI